MYLRTSLSFQLKTMLLDTGKVRVRFVRMNMQVMAVVLLAKQIGCQVSLLLTGLEQAFHG